MTFRLSLLQRGSRPARRRRLIGQKAMTFDPEDSGNTNSADPVIHLGMSVGLVLGAGGISGQAYQAGALLALRDHLGWDSRSAAIIVGTSAGSLTGTLLRLGVEQSDLVSMATHECLSSHGAALAERIWPDSSELPAPSRLSFLRTWRAPRLSFLMKIAYHPLAFRLGVAAATVLPAGSLDLTSRAAPLQDLLGDRWPEDLLICAARRSDGERVVFGWREGQLATLAAAVLASCAIPFYFAPVTIDGVEYLDGGVHSSTNADVLVDQRLDLVVVIAPMSTAKYSRWSADMLLRRSVHQKLRREVEQLEGAGMTVIRIEPGDLALDAMGLNPMDSGRAKRVVEAAYRETAARLNEGSIPYQHRVEAPAIA
jgi:NTE family protein